MQCIFEQCVLVGNQWHMMQFIIDWVYSFQPILTDAFKVIFEICLQVKKAFLDSNRMFPGYNFVLPYSACCGYGCKDVFWEKKISTDKKYFF